MARTPKIVEDRREQIIDAAMRAFSQKGYTRATNKDIAREAGITPGLIYHYFESKEALLKAIIEGRSPLKLVSTLPPQVLMMPSEDFLRFLLPRALNIVEEEGFVQLLRVIFPEVVYNPQIAQIVTGLLHRILGFLTTFFESRMQVGELRQTDPALAAQVCVGSVFAFVLRRQIVRDPLALRYTQEQMVDVVIETFLRGLESREYSLLRQPVVADKLIDEEGGEL